MNKLRISEQLLLPKDTVTSTLIVYGGKGMGKTNFGAVLVEELSKLNLRWCALDPLGVWWGLRYSQDGKSAGVECLILGGSHADFPIEPTGGAVVADMVIDETANFIIDFSRKPSGEMWSIGEKIRFITDYAYRLFQRQGELVKGVRREPIFQLLDEAARYIPQTIPAGAAELAKCVSAWEQLVEEGRNIGIGVGLLTQRSARMNKSVSEVADAVFSFRIVGPNSIGAITDWLGEHVPKQQINSMIEKIRSLDRGSCLIVSPGWLQFEGVVKIRERETFDSSATPKPGERARRVSGEGAKPDLAKYAERMKASVERAKENDPKELKAEVARLKLELSKKQVATPAQTKPVVDEKAIERAIKTATAPLLKQIEQIRRQAKQTIENFTKAAAPLNAIANLPEQEIPVIPAPIVSHAHAVDVIPGSRLQPTIPSRHPQTEHTNGNGHGELSGPERKILRALSELLSINMQQPSKECVAAWAGYSPNGGAFTNPLGSMRTKGWVDYPQSGLVSITDDGLALIGHCATPDQNEVRRRVEATCSGPEQKILRALLDTAGQGEISKTDLAEKSGYSPDGGAFTNPLGAMRTKGLLDYPRQGFVRAADWLFL